MIGAHKTISFHLSFSAHRIASPRRIAYPALWAHLVDANIYLGIAQQKKRGASSWVHRVVIAIWFKP